MFILELEQTNEAPALDQILQKWWAKLKARFGGRTEPEAQSKENERDRERSKSLIL
jgi:hypothetical protein